MSGDKLEELIKTVINDPNIDDREYKAFFIVCLSGGLRVTEGLRLKKSSFMVEDGQLFAESGVLKKRQKKETRYSRVHPAGQEFVLSFLDTKIGKIFDWDRSTAFRKIKKYFRVEGLCNHSLRHSIISYYLFEEGLSREMTSKLVHINNKTIDHYAHLDEKKFLKKVFNKKPA